LAEIADDEARALLLRADLAEMAEIEAEGSVFKAKGSMSKHEFGRRWN